MGFFSSRASRGCVCVCGSAEPVRNRLFYMGIKRTGGHYHLKKAEKMQKKKHDSTESCAGVLFFFPFTRRKW
jgi:hypothetical protein